MDSEKIMRCDKRRYPDKIGAMIALSSCQRRQNIANDWNRQEIRIYKCKFCWGWHLTSEKLIPGGEHEKVKKESSY